MNWERSYRLQAWQGDTGNEALALEAMTWFERGMALNRYDYEMRLGYGMCLDWLDRPKEATKYFVQGLELFPNNARVQWKYAWHCSILGNYSLALVWLERSMEVAAQPGSRGILGNGQRKDGGGQPGRPGRAIKPGQKGEKRGRKQKWRKKAKKPLKLVDILPAEGNLALIQHFNPNLL